MDLEPCLWDLRWTERPRAGAGLVGGVHSGSLSQLPRVPQLLVLVSGALQASREAPRRMLAHFPRGGEVGCYW